MQVWPELAPHARTIQSRAEAPFLHIYDAGPVNAPPVLLIHGLGDEADTWRHIIPALSTHQRVIAPDLPGFGRSDKSPRSYTIDFYRETMMALIDELSLQKVTLIGSSMGAIISQAIALEDPQKITGMILVDGSMLTRKQHLNLRSILFLIPWVGETLYTQLRKDPQAAYRSLEPYYHDLESMPQADRDFLYQHVNQRVWDDNQRYAYFSSLRSMVTSLAKSQKELEEQLSNLETPTLVVWGSDDKIVPIENADLLMGIQKNIRKVIVPEAGHLPHQENPEGFLQALSSDERLNIKH